MSGHCVDPQLAGGQELQGVLQVMATWPSLVLLSWPGQQRLPWAPGISMGMELSQGQAEMSNEWSKLTKVHVYAEQSCGGLGDWWPQTGLKWGPGLWPQGVGSTQRRLEGAVKSPSALIAVTLLSSVCCS